MVNLGNLLWSTCGFAAVLSERVAASKQILSLRGPEHLAYTGVYIVYSCLALYIYSLSMRVVRGAGGRTQGPAVCTKRLNICDGDRKHEGVEEVHNWFHCVRHNQHWDAEQPTSDLLERATLK